SAYTREAATEPVDENFENYPTALNVLNGAREAGSGYMAMLLSDAGRGFYVMEDGPHPVQKILPWFQEIASLSPGEKLTFHVKDDGITSLQEDIGAVACVACFDWTDGTKGYCLYFDRSWEEELLLTGKGKSLMTIVDIDGTILMRSNISDYFVRGENYWKLLGTNAEASAKYHITRKDNYAVYDATSDYTVIEIPMTGTTWAVCVSVSDIYVNNVTNKYFTNTKRLLIELAISVVGFFVLLFVMNLISKKKHLRESQALGDKADHDQLTGLRNKAATERDIEEFMRLNPNQQSLLFILDIDDFKSVNDTMGHSFGDDVLHEFGFRLGSMFRASDIAGRIGGDEFMVFVKNIGDDATIEHEARKIREFIKSFRAGEGVKREITASSGAAVFPADGRDFETLYKSADKALYESKRSGKRQLSFFRK
ncbi:MAG: GGDEF domain-containing protein, partial [Lachnospiraceae bacterium]|nr:GGDEF domain-containing protein [Lachnospiraceae bacterium]